MDPPWQFWADVDDNEKRRLDVLVALGGALAIITMVFQWRVPAPYGRHDPKDGTWGPRVNQRIAHMLNDGLWGAAFFVFLLYRSSCYTHFGLVNATFALLWLIHFVHRGFLHPHLMRYSDSKVALGIPLTGLTLGFFTFTLTQFLCMAVYDDDYIWDVRFQTGIVIFVVGFIMNRTSDWTLKSLRPKAGVSKYYVPKGGLFNWVTCPNYLGEMVQWLGWALATWSWVGFAYFCFSVATFVPRANHNHKWYILKFKNYPRKRKALIPFIY